MNLSEAANQRTGEYTDVEYWDTHADSSTQSETAVQEPIEVDTGPTLCVACARQWLRRSRGAEDPSLSPYRGDATLRASEMPFTLYDDENYRQAQRDLAALGPEAVAVLKRYLAGAPASEVPAQKVQAAYDILDRRGLVKQSFPPFIPGPSENSDRE